MAELRPFPFGALATRMFRELRELRSIFDLPEGRFFLGDSRHDLSVDFHGRRASTPLGPAAGPQSQMAQNIVLSWLGGSRIHELKTVQVDDRLQIPRPCIDMQTVGYNVEWSQELRLEESLEEYVKGAMLVEMLVASGELDFVPGTTDTRYDMSVGYDLAGIRSETVQAFMRGMLDCGDVVDRLRGELSGELARFRDLEFPTRLSDTLTLSTFHGCPPDEIERISEFLLDEVGVHTVVKLNPMLLGPERTRELLNGELGYEELHCPDTAFERDTTWEEARGFVERLGDRAVERGLGFGVKFTNTLIVLNHRDFFPGEREMYLSGPPLHVLAMNLVRRFRATFGDRWPISFSAGIDRKNFPEAVALGLVPVTVCSDLLKPGGYARSKGYFDELALRIDETGATHLSDYVVRAYGLGGEALDRLELPPHAPERRACEEALASGADLRAAAGDELYARWVSEAKLLNTEHYVATLSREPRYRSERNQKVPRKIGSHLELFDCITCDKCIPVCPNDANFTFVLPPLEVPIVKVRKDGERWVHRQDGVLKVEQKHQIANFADFCNDCGNCDIFCPEDGGPYVIKPRFFGTLEDWRRFEDLDGFCLERRDDGDVLHGRIDGGAYRAIRLEGRVRFEGEGFCLTLDPDDPLGTLDGDAVGEVDLVYCELMRWIGDAVFGATSLTYPSVRVSPSP